MENFRKGDKVRRINEDYNHLKVGDVKIVLSAGDDGVYFEGDTCGYSKGCFELVSRDYKPDEFEKYMVYGTGCDNKSKMYSSEKEMSAEARKVVRDKSWSGDIIGYKLVPIFRVEKKTVLKKFKTSPKKPKAKK